MKIAVGWSGKNVSKMCKSCKNNELEIVQVQNKIISLGKINLIGKGIRTLGYECKNCFSIFDTPKIDQFNDKIKKSNLMFSMKRNTSKTSLKISHELKFPILSIKERAIIRKQNFKEGRLSMIIGSMFALIIFILTKYDLVSFFILFLSITGGLYAMYEDPERVFRDKIKSKTK